MNTQAPAHIQQVRVAETVAAELRSRILRGDFADGMLPKQEQLRDAYGISHPSLREALRILETEGLVSVKRGNVGGAVVQRPSEGQFAYSMGLALESAETSMQALAASVALLEPLCVRMCAEHPERSTLIVPKLREVLATASEAIDGPSFTRLARGFHQAVVDLCGNRPIQLIVGGMVKLWTVQEENWADLINAKGAYPNEEIRRKGSTEVHEHLIDLIEAGLADEAERTFREHVESTHKVVLAKVKGRSIDASSPRARHSLLNT
ncbi:FadR/GntR family transcriptional regulator [Arthrobacter sp. KNU-44]|uniref:FadR/GntR family transcriptional regulator n=1 Tax=Arthrobacter sp. KNU-44 TaxID=3450744 RepID=UPI003F444263